MSGGLPNHMRQAVKPGVRIPIIERVGAPDLVPPPPPEPVGDFVSKIQLNPGEFPGIPPALVLLFNMVFDLQVKVGALTEYLQEIQVVNPGSLSMLEDRICESVSEQVKEIVQVLKGQAYDSHTPASNDDVTGDAPSPDQPVPGVTGTPEPTAEV